MAFKCMLCGFTISYDSLLRKEHVPTRNLLEKSLRVLKLPRRLSNLIANG